MLIIATISLALGILSTRVVDKTYGVENLLRTNRALLLQRPLQPDLIRLVFAGKQPGKVL